MTKVGISEDTFKFGLNIGKQMVKESKFIDYFSLNGLKPYFEINNNYVLNKIKIISFPFLYLFKKQSVSSEMNNMIPISDELDNNKTISPSRPDLYIPVMSFITYVLLIGFFAASLNSKVFDPQILGRIARKDIFFIMLQVFICKIILFIFSPTKISFLDCLSYVGYKFFLLVFAVLTWIFLGNFKIISYFVLILICVLSVLFLNLIYKERLSQDGKMKKMILLIFSIVEVLSILLIILDIHLYCNTSE